MDIKAQAEVQKNKLNDEAAAKIEKIQGVEAVSPIIEDNAKIISGRYMAYVQNAALFYKVKAAGTLKQGDYQKDYYVFMPIDEVKKLRQKEDKVEQQRQSSSTNGGINNSNSNTGNSSKKISYTRLMVKIEDIKKIKEIQTQIGSMGYQTESLNDMVESAFIGLIGGAIGIVLCIIISNILNKVGGKIAGGMGPGTKISCIPYWLIILSVCFTTFVGIASGFVPARKATKLSALEAIKTE